MFVTSSGISISRALPSDLDACALLISDFEHQSFDEWRTRFAQDLVNPARQFLVATVDDVVVAYGHRIPKFLKRL